MSRVVTPRSATAPRASVGGERVQRRRRSEPPPLSRLMSSKRRDGVALLLAWAMVVGLSALAGVLQAAPTELPLAWLPMGAATMVAMRSRSAWDTLGLLLALALPPLCLGALGWAPQPPLGALLATALIGSLQARHTGFRIRHLWRDLVNDRRRPHLRRLCASLRFVFVCTLPWALLAGAAMAGLDALGHALGWSAWPEGVRPGLGHLLPLALLYAAASGLSVVVLTPVLNWNNWRLPPWRLALPVLLLVGVLAAYLHARPELLYAIPLLVMGAAWLGGYWMGCFSVALVWAALLQDVQSQELTPFEGPAGFVVMLLLVWRLLGASMLMTLWHERRLQFKLPLGRRLSGAQVFRNVASLERVWPKLHAPEAAAVRVAWLHIDLGAERAPGAASALAELDVAPGIWPNSVAQGQFERSSQMTSALPSPRLPSLMHVVAGALRADDAVAPIAGEALIAVVQRMEPRHLARLIDRIDVSLVREGARHVAPAQVRQAVVVEARVAALLLASARYLTADADG